MRLKLMLPGVDVEEYGVPVVCPGGGCGGTRFKLMQSVSKRLRDTAIGEVVARRYRCVRCGQTFRVYPRGVSRAQCSARLKGVGVLLYVLGLSYGAVALALQALGHPFGKTAVYDAVQAAGERVPGLRRSAIELPKRAGQVSAIGADLTSVKCRGKWLSVGVGVDAISGIALTVDLLESSEAETLTKWLEEVATAVGAELVVTDDADGFKQAADEIGLAHQICKSHVLRNTKEWVEQAKPGMSADADGSLAEITVRPEQALADCEELLRLMRDRARTPGSRATGEATLETIHRRYVQAAPPKRGAEEKASLAYRLRLFTLDRWNLWSRLTLYRTWKDSQGRTLDGTNNATERVIGWWIKERYRTMRGYKREQSVLNVSRLIAWAGGHLTTGGADLATVVA
jgi:hypothetical protein